VLPNEICLVTFKDMKKLLLSLLGIVFITISAQAGTSRVVLAWDASPSSDVNRYKVYVAPGTNTVFLTNNSNATIVVTVTNQLTATVSNLNSGAAYSFVATALTTNNLESSNSVEIWTYIPFSTPSVPANLRFTSIIP